jgi:transposase
VLATGGVRRPTRLRRRVYTHVANAQRRPISDPHAHAGKACRQPPFRTAAPADRAPARASKHCLRCDGSNHCVTGIREPDMLTGMTERDWSIVLEVFDAAQSNRGEPGRDDRKFLEAVHYFTVHSITWRALPSEFGKWNSVWIWKRFWRLSRSGVFEAFSSCWRNAARRHTWSNSSTARQRAPTFRPLGQKGAASPGVRPLARRFFDQNPPQD